MWATGEFGASLQEEAKAKLYSAQGACSILIDVIEISYETLQTELSDDK